MKPKANYISPEQFQDMLDYVPELHVRKWRDYDIQMSMKIAYYCGLRYGEVPNLTKENFDFERKEVYLGKTKTKSNYGSIPPMFMNELKTYLDTKKPLEPILGMNKNQQQNLGIWLDRIGEALNIEALTTPQSITGEKTKKHIFRKSIGKDIIFGTFGKNGTLPHAQSHLRHSNPVTTGRYLRLDIEGSKEFFEDTN